MLRTLKNNTDLIQLKKASLQFAYFGINWMRWYSVHAALSLWEHKPLRSHGVGDLQNYLSLLCSMAPTQYVYCLISIPLRYGYSRVNMVIADNPVLQRRQGMCENHGDENRSSFIRSTMELKPVDCSHPRKIFALRLQLWLFVPYNDGWPANSSHNAETLQAIRFHWD